MKELSIEEKAKAYDKAVSEIRNLRDMLLKEGIINKNGVICNNFNRIFPELKESEDERIRKAIGYAIGQSTHSDGTLINGVSSEEALTWLEKQGSEESIDPDTLIQQRVDALADIVAEQKFADKIEPKFKDGDWIIHNTYYNLIYYVDSILSPQSNCYCLNSKGGTRLMNFSEQDNYHLWTIQDAKDGDVLRIRNLTFIFQEITNNNVCHKDAAVAYCSYEDNDDGFNVCGPDCITDLEIITPATKEQRDTLEKAMADAGYKWDDEKKLERIIDEKQGEQKSYASETMNEKRDFDSGFTRMMENEQKPAWSKEDENIKESIITGLEMLKDGASDQSLIALYNKKIDWLKSLRPRSYWKPSDEQMDALCYVTNFDYGGYKATLVLLYEQLKKLKG